MPSVVRLMGERIRCSFISLTLQDSEEHARRDGLLLGGPNGELSNTCQPIIGTSSMCVSGQIYSAQLRQPLREALGEQSEASNARQRRKKDTSLNPRYLCLQTKDSFH